MKLEARGIEKWFFRGRGDSNRFFAVQKTDLTLEPGTVTVLTGRSGSGKTTLLHMLSGILTPDGGQILADGRDLYGMDDKELSEFRNAEIGMLMQGADILPELTVMENILLPAGITRKMSGRTAGKTSRKTSGEMSDLQENALHGNDLQARALELLAQMEIDDLKNVPGKELSGGERRRVCLVRALINQPGLIFADEPTSDLDDENMHRMLRRLSQAADDGAAVFIVTHDMEALDYADVKLEMKDGSISGDSLH